MSIKKVIAFIIGSLGLIIATIFSTLGIQNWKKPISMPPEPVPITAAVLPVAPVTPTLAQVIAVNAHFQTAYKPQRICKTKQQVITPSPTPVENNIPLAGSLIGGVAGGLAGSVIQGKHHGLGIGTGAVLGALAGGAVQNSHQNVPPPEPQIIESTHCINKTIAYRVPKGYEVTLAYNNQITVIHMNEKPILNSWIPIPKELAPPANTTSTATPQNPTTSYSYTTQGK